MTRETKTIELGLGFTAEVVTYFTQGERRTFSDVLNANRTITHTVEKVLDGGKTIEKTTESSVPSPDCYAKIQDAQVTAGVISISGLVQGTDVLMQAMNLPDSCFKKLYQALADLTPREQTEDEKKGESAAPGNA